MTVPAPSSTPPARPNDLAGLVRVAIVVLAVGFVLTAGGSVWTILTPAGTGVNFPAGLLYLLGFAVGIMGLALGTAAFIGVSRAARRP